MSMWRTKHIHVFKPSFTGVRRALTYTYTYASKFDLYLSCSIYDTGILTLLHFYRPNELP